MKIKNLLAAVGLATMALTAAADFVKPKAGEWIEVTGEATLDEQVLPGVFLTPVSVKILAKRGKELVTR